MKIAMTKTVELPKGERLVAGAQYEVSDAVGNAYVADGRAVVATDPPAAARPTPDYLPRGAAKVVGAAPDAPDTVLTAAQLQALAGGSSGASLPAPATLDSSNASTYNGQSVDLPAGATLTVDGSAWAALPGGLTINVGQGGTATLAFSGSATKENASGTSTASVTLAASGVYVLLRSPSGTPKFRLSGGASL